MAGEAQQAIDVIQEIPELAVRFAALEELEQLLHRARVAVVDEAVHEFQGKRNPNELAAQNLGVPLTTVTRLRRGQTTRPQTP